MNQEVEDFKSNSDNVVVDIKQSGKYSEHQREYNNELDAMGDCGQVTGNNKQQYFRDTGCVDNNNCRPGLHIPNGGNNLNSYKINYDPEPQIVRKQVSNPVLYKQEVAVRYLKPPTPPPPGPLIIKEVRANQPPPAPPVIIRQRPPRPSTPPPLVIRERPPQAPQPLGPKVITRNLPPPPPPPRRVIIERLPPLPPKPRSIIVERWLPYKQVKRRVVYQRAPQVETPQSQKNLIIQWEGAQVKVQKEFRNLGISRADPNMYIQQYGPQLKPSSALPDFARSVGLPPNVGNNDHHEQGMFGMIESTDAIPNYMDNGNQFVSGLPPELLSQAMDGDSFGNHMNIVTGAEIEGAPGFNSIMPQYHDMQYDDARGSFQMGDPFSMMNAADQSMDMHQGSIAGKYGNHNFSNSEFGDMNDGINDPNSAGMMECHQSVAPLLLPADHELAKDGVFEIAGEVNQTMLPGTIFAESLKEAEQAILASVKKDKVEQLYEGSKKRARLEINSLITQPRTHILHIPPYFYYVKDARYYLSCNSLTNNRYAVIHGQSI
ncbi:hypothetical protein GJ496_011894 [Pomphorhynchus laevis]|nr:hypothetical protein GJ496_011894 [Pomphorhynchus laevis]